MWSGHLHVMWWAFFFSARTAFCDTSASSSFMASAGHEWKLWQSQHPDKSQSSRQKTMWQELIRTHADGSSSTGLTGGLLKLEPAWELPSHYHPEPFGEVYHFIRGDGYVKLNEFTPSEHKQAIFPGLHLNIPAGTLHGIDAGASGCELLWMFSGRRWADIPYLYADPLQRDRNIPVNFSRPLPSRVKDWGTLWQNISSVRMLHNPKDGREL